MDARPGAAEEKRAKEGGSDERRTPQQQDVNTLGQICHQFTNSAYNSGFF